MQVKSIAECSKREHSTILSTFIKLPFVIKIVVLSIFEGPLKTGFTVFWLFCRVFPGSDSRETILLEEINKWLTCRFADMDLDSLIDDFHRAQTRLMKHFHSCAKSPMLELRRLRKNAQYAVGANFTTKRFQLQARMTSLLQVIRACLANVTSVCNKAHVRVIKLIRIPLTYVQHLLPKYPNMKVIYLQRDPRGIFQSRQKTHLVKKDMFNETVDMHCKRVDSDLEQLTMLQRKYPGRLKPILYEELAERPLKVSESLFDFCGLNFTLQTQNYILSTTSSGGADSCHFCVARGNSTETAYKWRKTVSLNDVLYIDKKCSASYETLGYKKLFNLNVIRNMSVPIRSKDNPFMYPYT